MRKTMCKATTTQPNDGDIVSNNHMRIALIVALQSLTFWLCAQTTYTLSGYVQDGQSGESLIGATLSTADNRYGVSTNVYGFYSLTLPEGDYSITCSYIGYADEVLSINLTENTKQTIELSEGVAIETVVITEAKTEARDNVESTKMGTIALPVSKIKKLPAIFGEVDLLKSLQLLPGVLSSGEGSAGFAVRGGGADQNLVLLDDAVVYNTGHLLGFFSVFNADAIRKTTLIKGGMPAAYGGRLSSVVDIQMKEGNDKFYQVEGGIGLVSSRLTVQGPIAKEKASFIVSARRTYALDLARPLLRNTDFAGTNYYFYDLNAKVNYRISDKDRLYLSTYIGQDELIFRQPLRDLNFDLPYGNRTATLRYNRQVSDQLFANASLIYNDYRFEISGDQDNFSFRLFSGVEDYTAKVDFDYYPSPRHSIKFGLVNTYHIMTPNTASATSVDVDFSNEFEPKRAHESGIYLQDDIRINNSLSINAGLRYAFFTQVGPYVSVVDGREFDRGEPVVTYDGLEPRISGRWTLSRSTSLKSGYALTNQYLHLVSNSSTTLPTDIWVPSSDLVQPQRSHQYAIGYFKNFVEDNYETSVEVYYRDMNNQVDYADDYVDDISRQVEESFVYGEGRAYGVELFARKNTGKINGWVSYTYSKTERSFADIEDGRWFPAVQDRPHDISIVANYKINDRWDLGAIWVYGSGRAFTPLRSFYLIDGGLNARFGPRNSARLDDYHRLDLSATYTPRRKANKRWQSSWTLSFYNTYNRLNPFFVNYGIEGSLGEESFELSAEKITIFPIIPSITYNFKWAQE